VLFFEVHQPYRLGRGIHEKLVTLALRGSLEPKHLEDVVFDQGLNRLVFERATAKCYLPASRIMLENIRRFADSDRGFAVSFGVSGVFIEQASRWAPEVVEVFQELVATGYVGMVAQTYYHSVAPLIPGLQELEEHVKLLREVFGVVPTVVECTEFIYNNDTATSTRWGLR